MTLAIAAVRSVARFRPLTYLLAIASLGWLIWATVLFCQSALDTSSLGGFVGARAAREELQIVLAAGVTVLATAFLLLPLARRLVTVLLLITAIAAGAYFASTSHQTADVGAALLILGWCWLAGDTVLHVLGASTWSLGAAARPALAMGLGLALLSFAMLGVALAGELSDTVIAYVLSTGVLISLPRLRHLVGRRRATERTRRRGRRARRSPEVQTRPSLWASLKAGVPTPQIVEYVALAACGGLFLFGFAVCLTPQVNFDALHYHLAMPLIFLREGRFVERPDIIQSYFPLGLEMDYAVAFRLGGEATASLLHWAFAPLTAILLWSGGDRWFGRPAGAVAAGLFALAPLVVWESTAASSDLALTFYLVAGAYLLVLHTERPSAGLALVTGLLTGAALAFKLVAMLYVPVIAIVFIIVTVAKLRLRAWRSLLSYGVGGLLGGAPWLILRFVETGNPVFPLFNDVFKSDKWPPVAEHFDLGQFGLGTTASDLASVFWEASIHPGRFGQATPAWFIGLPLLAALAALPLLPRLGRFGALWTLTAVVALGAWLLLSQYHRYGLPAFALLAPVAAYAAVEAVKIIGNGHLRPIVLSALIGAWFAAGVTVAFATFSLEPDHFPRDALLGRESTKDFRANRIPDYTAIYYYDHATRDTDDEGVLLGFPYNYFAHNRLYDVIVPETLSPFRRIAMQELPPDELARQLLDARIRWFVFDARNPFIEDVYPPPWIAKSILSPEFFAHHLRIEFEEDFVFVFRIVNPPPPEISPPDTAEPSEGGVLATD